MMRRHNKPLKKGFRQAVKKARRIAAARGRPLRVMFADEARFGRMHPPRPCWAPAGVRPKVACQLVREFIYLYGPLVQRTEPAHFFDSTIVGCAMLPDILGRFGQEVFQVAYPADLGWGRQAQELPHVSQARFGLELLLTIVRTDQVVTP
jgi:hypothetical protein